MCLSSHFDSVTGKLRVTFGSLSKLVFSKGYTEGEFLLSCPWHEEKIARRQQNFDLGFSVGP